MITAFELLEIKHKYAAMLRKYDKPRPFYCKDAETIESLIETIEHLQRTVETLRHGAEK